MPKKKAFRRIGKLGPKGQRAVVVVRSLHKDTLFPEKLAKVNAILKDLKDIKF